MRAHPAEDDMRALVTLLLSALLLAGCTAPAADEEPEPASVDETEPTTPAATPPTPASPTPAPANATPPATQSHTPTPSPTPETPPPAPTLVAWNLTAQARIGWFAAAGAGGAAPAQGQSDADHCPDAAFGVPTGAKTLRVAIAGEPADPAGPSVGTYDITLTDPAGTAVHMRPVMENVPDSEDGIREFTAQMPAPGDWKLHAEPLGPAAQQVWTVTLDVGGESTAAPAALLVAPGC